MRRVTMIVLAVGWGVGCAPGRAVRDGATAGREGPRYDVGRPASAAILAGLDIDVSPSGAGLPAGRGTVADGKRLYEAQCANCHGAGAEGMGGVYPALAGRDPREGFGFATDPKLVHTIGNYWAHATTLVDYIRRAMPLTAPGTLTDDEVYAVSAYLLAVNELLPMDGALDSAGVMAIRMPAAGRFVRDDRRGGAEVK